jgi:HTH-type transcriptional regulator/antitoxin HigA
MQHMKIITSIQEHKNALDRVLQLMDSDFDQGSKESDELDVLALLIERYEDEQFPISLPDPIEAIKFRMDQQNLRNKDLIPYIGSAPKVSEILNKSRKLSLNMIRKLHHGLEIPTNVLIGEITQKSTPDTNVNWSSFPITEMRKNGYFSDTDVSIHEMKEYAEETLTSFITSVSKGLNLKPALLRTSAHLRSNDKKTDDYALWAWQVRVLQKAQGEQLPTDYKLGTVDLKWMKKLSQLSWSEHGPTLAKEYLNSRGIHLITEQHLSKTYLDGAACIGDDGNPIVALTLRHNRLDNFWFTLMHELAHISLHLEESESWFIDDLDSATSNSQELEADSLAQEALYPDKQMESLAFEDADTVRDIAKEMNISPCIIAGRLRHERKNHALFGKLFRDKIRYHFENIC